MLRQYRHGGPSGRSSRLRADNPAGEIAREALYGWPGFGNAPYYYGFIPFQWEAAPLPRWKLPPRVVGLVDLRTTAQQAQIGGTPQGFAFVTSVQPIETLVSRSLHFGTEGTTTPMRDAWEAELGYRPDGPNVVDLLWDHLTNGADPDGQTQCKPLVPTVGGQLELHMGGHSLVKRERFRWGRHPYTNKLRTLLRRGFEAEWERTNGDDHNRRCLDATCEKYRVSDWREFVPPRLHAHVPGRLAHQTTITDDFNRADGAIGSSSEGWSWTNVTGVTLIVTNRAECISGNDAVRAESDLSSADHYSQADLSVLSGNADHGACGRFAAAATTYYLFMAQASGRWALYKIVAGSFTLLDSETTDYVIPTGEAFRNICNGSTISGTVATVEKCSATDTAITGNTRTGLNGFVSGGRYDNFEAADLAAAVGRRAWKRLRQSRNKALVRM